MDVDAKCEQANRDLEQSMTNYPNSQLVFEMNVLRFAYVKIHPLQELFFLDNYGQLFIFFLQSFQNEHKLLRDRWDLCDNRTSCKMG